MLTATKGGAITRMENVLPAGQKCSAQKASLEDLQRNNHISIVVVRELYPYYTKYRGRHQRSGNGHWDDGKLCPKRETAQQQGTSAADPVSAVQFFIISSTHPARSRIGPNMSEVVPEIFGTAFH